MLQAANSIYSPHFAIWPAKRNALEKAVCHLAACGDNNYVLMTSKSSYAKIKENNVKTLFLHRVALVIILLYYSFGIITIECFSGLQLRNCCL